MPVGASLFCNRLTNENVMNNTNIRYSINSIFCTIALVALLGCGSKKEFLPVAAGVVASPSQVFVKSKLFSYEGKYKRWVLESEHMTKPLDPSATMLVSPVRLSLFDSLGRISTYVLADSGSTNSLLENFLLWGNVYIRNQDSLVVRSQKLLWHKKNATVTSDTYVQIETKRGDVLRGKGLDAVEDFSRFTFKHDVSGKFPNFKQRMDENDTAIF